MPLSANSALIRLSHPHGSTVSMGSEDRSSLPTNNTSAAIFPNGATAFSANLMSSTSTQSPSSAQMAGSQPNAILSSCATCGTMMCGLS